MAPHAPSPFLDPGLRTSDGKLALIALSRQSTIPAVLRSPNLSDPTDEITNTRFGSFPHGTLLNKEWGTQIVASKIDARDKRRGKKRKRNEEDSAGDSLTPGIAEEEADTQDSPAFEAASSGFAHILPPTPELWTYSLSHRTQVVYTPDYSYILQRLRVRPGATIIEAGAGSGSFTHAAARAVFNGSISHNRQEHTDSDGPQQSKGKVYSFEYHEPRYEELEQEIRDHGLQDIVHITHRDVYEGGFLLYDSQSPKADAVFLDLPAPWRALDHLTRGSPSPLNPSSPIRLCTFSPCIEQVEQTVFVLRRLGWIEIDMVEIQHKRIDVRRERVGLQEEGLRGVNAVPASVEEAVVRLRQLEDSQAEFHKKQQSSHGKQRNKVDVGGALTAKRARAETNKRELGQRKVWKEGVLCHRSEPELKTHTSYLVFAVLPQSWTEEDEALAMKQWAEKEP